MSTPKIETIRTALEAVSAGDAGGTLGSNGWIADLLEKDGHVTATLAVPKRLGPALEPVRKNAETTIHAMDGVLTATVVLTAENEAPQQAAQQQQGQQVGRGGRGGIELPTVKHIVAVASGKGGVGKSTTTVNLALALSKLGLKVAVFDADVFGPSMPRMMGLKDQKPQSDGKSVEPLENHGVKVMSMGFMVAEDNPVVWRGPMVMGALEQMLRDVAWGDIDVMLVDMPPGTGDTQLTMSQRVPLAGAVIVSTPQDIALLDARKGLNMFKKVEVPILGVVENMSYHICSNCGHREEIFAHGGAAKAAKELGVPYLGDLPLDIRIRETSDGGTPIVAAEPDSAHTQAYLAIAGQVKTALEGGTVKKAPKISLGGLFKKN